MASIPQEPKRPSSATVRFGAFELNLDSGELCRQGRLVSLQEQQAVVLKYLVERTGRTVTREELRTQIWPEGTYVEFETGLYNTINRLRRSLGDSASNPHFIETVPKEGYRFIAAVEYLRSEEEEMATPVPSPGDRLAQSSEPAWRASPSSAIAAVPRWFYLSLAAVGLLLLGGLMGTFLWPLRRQPSGTEQVYRYAIPVPGVEKVASLAISPNGDQIVFQGANRLLWRRYLDRTDPRPILGAEDGVSPFFSPDGQSVGFFSGRSLKIAEGEHLRQLAVLPSSYPIFDATWGEDGFVYFNTRIGSVQGIWRIPARGGKCELIAPSLYPGTGPVHPLINQVLTSPRHLLIYSTNSGPLRRSLHVRDLDTQVDRTVIARGVGGYLLPNGELTFYNRGSLFGVGFDSHKLQALGTPMEMVKGVAAYSWQSGLASVSRNGTLVYIAQGEPELKLLQWVDSSGQVTPLPLPPDQYEQAEVSPRGDLLAIVRTTGVDRASLWVYGLRTGGWQHILDSDVPRLRAQWNPDGKALVVSSARQNDDFTNLYRVPLANPDKVQRLTEQPDYGQFPLSWSGKANAILLVEGVHERTHGDIFVLPLGGKMTPKPLVASPGWDRSASFSPDGRWFVYESEEQGRPEIFIRRYDAAKGEASGAAVKISSQGGHDPVWAPDGRSIYYSDLSQQLVQATLSGGARPLSRRMVGVSMPQRTDYWTRTTSIAPDGRLLVIRPVSRAARPAEIQVVVNWASEVKRLSPAP